MITDKTVREVLAADGVGPDFAYAESEGSLDFIHRTTEGAEIYFVANRNARADEVSCTFRVIGKQPELWDPVTGEMRDATGVTVTEKDTTVTLRFAPHQSWFVVFRKPLAASSPAAARPPAFPARALPVTGPWIVQFDPQWGGPETVEFAGLTDWTQNSNHGIRYYSGKATYRKNFELPSDIDSRERLVLDLGKVGNLAEVRLNGVRLGVVWTAPWEIEITRALRRGENRLEIDGVNLWPNRLIGDKYLPPAKRFTRTNVPLKDDARLLPSGLLGPVSIRSLQP
jgi:hypothetical protein